MKQHPPKTNANKRKTLSRAWLGGMPIGGSAAIQKRKKGAKVKDPHVLTLLNGYYWGSERG